MLSLTDCPINWFSLPALILENSLSQSWSEWNWRVWSRCTGWCSESEPELDNSKVRTILTSYWPTSRVLWAWYGCPGWQWSLCGLLVLWRLVLVTTVTFLTVWAFVVEGIPTSMSYQYTSNRSVEFMHRLGCYDSCNEIYLTTILKHFACVRIWCTNVSHINCVETQTGIIHLFWIYHCHSNRNILSPILLTHSDGIRLC